ncbi:RPL18, partial [Cervus elaphus hippelaphus]
MTRVTVPVIGGARIRIQKLVPQPLLRVLPVYSVTPQPGKLGAGGGVIKRLVPMFGSQAGFRSRFNSLPTAFPVTGKHLFVGDSGVDIRHNKDRKVRRKEPKSQDIYLRLLVK